MRTLRFEKVHGLGNDFVLLDLRAGGPPLSSALAARLCDRRRGVGADGVLTLRPPEGEADLQLLIQNADGSVPEMCGNGLRCVVDVVRDGRPGGPVRVETGAGLRLGWVEPSGEVKVTLGAGRVLETEVPVTLGGVHVDGRAVDMGNPHLVLFLAEGPDREAPLRELADRFGPELEHHPRFPERVNVGFARPHAEGIDLVVFERGAGRTEACGTGAGACALAARVSGRWSAPGPVPMTLPGGPLRLEVPASGQGDVLLAGPTARVYRGEMDVDG
jgi:diaminopimelate epimerase